jgi:hypothetical protein
MSGVGIVNLPATLTSQDVTHMQLTYQQYIQANGLLVNYYPMTPTGVDAYGQATYSSTPQQILAVLSDITSEEFRLVEPGFLPTQYAVLWEYQVTPNIGDRVAWENIWWEIRGVYPTVIDNQIIFYKTLIRRIIMPSNLQQYIGGNNP